MKSCLLVDDSRVVRKVARRIFEDFGFVCDEAEDGDKAFRACQDALPDVILLDWNMPVMSGLEFLEKIRRVQGGQQPKIIFCTTENDFSHISRAITAGATEYIMKPFDSETIRLKLLQLGAIES